MSDTSQKLDDRLRPAAESALAPGEQLNGFLVATQSGVFKGGMRVLVITDDRLVVQPLTRDYSPKGEAISIRRADVASVRTSGLGGGWYDSAVTIAAWAGIELTVRTFDGLKVKLSMMKGEGGLIGRLGGGETQRIGVEALKQWLELIEH